MANHPNRTRVNRERYIAREHHRRMEELDYLQRGVWVKLPATQWVVDNAKREIEEARANAIGFASFDR